MRAREEDRSSIEASSSSSSPSVSPSDGVDGGGSLVGLIIGELELRSPKPKPSVGVSV